MVGRGAEMRNNLRRLVALALFAIALTGAATAQTYSHVVRADIPFNFYAGSKLLTAGTYTFSINIQDHNVMIGNARKDYNFFLLGSPNDALNNGITLLTFRSNGEGAYVLQKLRGDDFGLSFNTGKGRSYRAMDQRADPQQTVVAKLLR
jgi:hypothetical protein